MSKGSTAWRTEMESHIEQLGKAAHDQLDLIRAWQKDLDQVVVMIGQLNRRLQFLEQGRSAKHPIN
jgi:hypothetical protein